MKSTLIKLIALASLSTTPLWANTIPSDILLWDNQQGLIKNSGCVLNSSTEHPFLVTDSKNKKDSRIENLRNLNGVVQSNLITGSIAKKIKSKHKVNYTELEIIGVNTNPEITPNKWYTQKGDKGYLFNKSLRPIEDNIIEIKGVKGLGHLVALQSSEYQYLACQGRKYYIFKNYETLKSSHPKSFVAISDQETAIFNHIVTRKIEDIDNDSLKNNLHGQEEVLTLDKLFKADITIDEIISEGLEIDVVMNSGIKILENAASDDDVEIKIEEDLVMCIPNEKINVRDESLDKVLFQAVNGEVVQIFQNFDDNDEIKKELNGIEYTYVKVKFTKREEKDQLIGRVAKRFILPKSKCRYVPNSNGPSDKANVKITGLADKLCCDFPTIKKVTHPFDTGMRRFAANRGKGKRSHAACDLYRKKDEPIVAVAPGKVIRGLHYFYQGTYALEVKHDGGFIVRYGELTGKAVLAAEEGKDVSMGERLGHIGVVNSNCCLPMLHFELYKGDKTGPLSASGNKFQRRSDLMDPTFYLQKWEGMTFHD